jgi:hypothetical protein
MSRQLVLGKAFTGSREERRKSAELVPFGIGTNFAI